MKLDFSTLGMMKIFVTAYLLLCIALLATATSNLSPYEDDLSNQSSYEADSSDSETQLTLLNSKIEVLETQIKTQSDELKLKDEIILEKEKNILEKLKILASLKTNLSVLEEKGKQDANEKAQKVQDRANVLEKEVKNLRKTLLTSNGDKEALEIRVKKAERKINDLNETIKRHEKINDDQKEMIHETAKALKHSEDELIMVKLEIKKVKKTLKEIHGAWLPPWLTEQYNYYQALLQSHWALHGEPILELLVQKASDRTAEANRWAEPHIATIKTKWVPAVKEHAQLLTAKAMEAYDVSKTAISPHLIKAQVFVIPYYQKWKKVSRPYIEQVASTAEPHVKKLKLVMKPYTKKASVYHRQMQLVVTDSLGKFDITKPLAASNEFVWFAASGLLTLPVIIIMRSISALLRQKTISPSRNGRSHHSRRKTKRDRSDK